MSVTYASMLYASCFSKTLNTLWMFMYPDFNAETRPRGLVYPDLGPQLQSRPLPSPQLLLISGSYTPTNDRLSPNRHMLWYLFP